MQLLDFCVFCKLLCRRFRRPIARDFHFPITLTGPNRLHIQCKELLMFDLMVGVDVHVSIGKPVDKFGNEAAIQGGSPTVEALNPDLATFDTSAPSDSDGWSGWIRNKATVLDPDVTKRLAVFRVSGDADLGDGVTNISEDIPVNLVAGQATGFGAFSFGSTLPSVATPAPTPPAPTAPPADSTPPADATPPVDSSTPPVDTGTAPVDSSTPPTAPATGDTGTPTDAPPATDAVPPTDTPPAAEATP